MSVKKEPHPLFITDGDDLYKKFTKKIVFYKGVPYYRPRGETVRYNDSDKKHYVRRLIKTLTDTKYHIESKLLKTKP